VSVISLLTDFGSGDYFVGAMKGVILSINPKAVLVDLTHETAAQDVAAGAFTLLAAYRVFPPGTIHVAVVDPGVGSARRPIVVSTADQLFVGPDNGIFTYIYDSESSHETFHVTAEKYFRLAVSTTFHGRDVFAPVAAALSTGVEPSALGPPITDEVRLEESLKPVVQANGQVIARIVHIDRFGNCITNITRDVLPDGATLLVNGKMIRAFRTFFGEDVGSAHEPFAIWGSAGFLEIAINGRSAAEALGVTRGAKVLLKLS
jgi:S-adenosylmethionine hydrolase